jgi:hypothetical protein
MQNAELEKSPPDPGLHDEAFLTLEKLYRQHLYPVLLWLESRYDRDLDEVNKPFQNNLDQNFTSSTEPPLPLNSRVLKLSRLYTRMSHIQRPEAFDAWLRLRSRMSTSPSKAELTSQKVDAPLLTHSGYERPMYPRVHCGRCNLNPAGFRGQHELQRHMDTRHKHDTVNDDVDRWEWPSDLQSRFAALWRTSRREEHWNEAYYNAAAYLRRTHFKLKGSHLQADVTKQPQIPPSIFHTESSDSYISLNAELPVLHRELCRRELQFITVSAAVGLGKSTCSALFDLVQG